MVVEHKTAASVGEPRDEPGSHTRSVSSATQGAESMRKG